MPSAKQSLVPIQQALDSSAPVLFTVRGNSAKIDGAFGDADAVEVHGNITGDLRVGGLLVIGDQAIVNGNATAQRIRVEGEFTGDLRAAEDIEIASSGTVNGTLKCDEFVIERGGVFNGTATRTARQDKQQAAASTRNTRTESRQNGSNSSATATRSTLADVAAPPATSVLDFGTDDDNFDAYQGRQIPLA